MPQQPANVTRPPLIALPSTPFSAHFSPQFIPFIVPSLLVASSFWCTDHVPALALSLSTSAGPERACRVVPSDAACSRALSAFLVRVNRHRSPRSAMPDPPCLTPSIDPHCTVALILPELPSYFPCARGVTSSLLFGCQGSVRAKSGACGSGLSPATTTPLITLIPLTPFRPGGLVLNWSRVYNFRSCYCYSAAQLHSRARQFLPVV